MPSTIFNYRNQLCKNQYNHLFEKLQDFDRLISLIDSQFHNQEY